MIVADNVECTAGIENDVTDRAIVSAFIQGIHSDVGSPGSVQPRNGNGLPVQIDDAVLELRRCNRHSVTVDPEPAVVKQNICSNAALRIQGDFGGLKRTITCNRSAAANVYKSAFDNAFDVQDSLYNQLGAFRTDTDLDALQDNGSPAVYRQGTVLSENDTGGSTFDLDHSVMGRVQVIEGYGFRIHCDVFLRLSALFPAFRAHCSSAERQGGSFRDTQTDIVQIVGFIQDAGRGAAVDEQIASIILQQEYRCASFIVEGSVGMQGDCIAFSDVNAVNQHNAGADDLNGAVA